MIIRSDWHIHSAASYDADLSLEEIAEGAERFGYAKIGITDHANLNDASFLGDLRTSVKNVTDFQKTHSNIILGVELTPIEKPQFDYIKKHGVTDGYCAPHSSEPFEIELAQTKEELQALGVRYAIGAAHWRIDVPNGRGLAPELSACIKEWYRQQMWLAQDERVTVLGHPWYHGKGLWYEDFSVIPRSMNQDIAAVLKENGKYVECNSQFFFSKYSTERFRHQYADFLRELFEMGIPVTYGSDAHLRYDQDPAHIEGYLRSSGFSDGDFSELSERGLW